MSRAINGACKNPARWVSYIPWVGRKEHGLRIYVGVRDHEPPHVHVFSDEGSMKVLLGEACVELTEARGDMKEVSARQVAPFVLRHLDECWAVWEKYHG